MNDDLKNCTACGQFMPLEERDYWVFWASFRNLEIEQDVQCCMSCIVENLSDSHQDFVPESMRPETFVVFHHANQMNINLKSKLSEIDKGEFVRELSLVHVDEIVRWLNSDINIYEAEEWTHRFETFDEAMKWRSAGFTSKMDVEWVAWGLEPEEIIKMVPGGKYSHSATDLEFAPPVDFRNLGLNLSEAAEFRARKFHYSESRLPYWVAPENWLSNYPLDLLTIDEIERIRDDIEDDRDFSWDVSDENFWTMLRQSISTLRELKLEITLENLKPQIEFLETQVG